ncbi:tRNA (N6-isopentenyl adenosine(37)-C2)-methylthiotransferase MiaB [Paramaledivibacter caminithermalis]|jgi:tRNA-2-methylthio-N6-dimethylallyladenosine synthase|uniref:tRNA-2-methylthio-N(6)-dimethylallyladenosine synthase n=1 Tax=Paramaledivibacter caminithermalis (strain DSM 15212 / CIP 107654 / DViRD3) TaxID=1121301 RepID=A0A1M6JL15_PARC5|nr:tRNA (N6-isopentenyl adenosine(37)-C2)-methylthiotransferase MiaB [Paramaledivibacter caminithermalis]SHJ47388.1 tRNA-i(6)A37 thiotransferase enzyme MiaB [Paramaledivibacter caminithermalis DSM 15212]
MSKKKYLIKTYGCQMNEHDSEKLAGMLVDMDYIECEDKDDADLIIFNTCCVRENAELKVYGNLGQLKHLKRRNPDMIIAICGCMMQQAHVVEEIKKKYPFVDLIFGTHNLHNFPVLLSNCKQADNMLVEVWDREGEIVEGLPSIRKYGLKAFVNIMYGCNNFCTYCIVPYTRGRERSREPKDIIDEVKDLVEKGTKEITLLGQNVNSYGKTLEEKMDFADLLYKVNEVEGLERIRFMTSHPKDISKKLIEAIRDCDKVCEHIHLPVQAGGNNVLKTMNRKYTKEQYLKLIEDIRKVIPGISITTDIIVGFPGETDEDFEHTLDLVKRVKYDNAFTFIYSIRKGTPAAEMENQVPDNVKHDRFNRLLEVLHPGIKERNFELKDKIVEVLVEGESKNDENILMGRTRTNKVVNFSGPKDLIGRLCYVKITEPKNFSLYGELVEK